MFKKKNKIKKIMVSTICLIMLTGCSYTNTSFNYNKDGSGSVAVDVLLPNNTYIPEKEQDRTGKIDLSKDTEKLFKKSELKSFLQDKFKKWKVKEIHQKGYSGYEITGDYSNKQVKKIIDSTYSTSYSGVGRKYDVNIDLKNFLSTSDEKNQYEIDSNNSNSNDFKTIDEQTFFEQNPRVLESNSLFDYITLINKDTQIYLNINLPGKIYDYNVDDKYITEKNDKSMNIDLASYLRYIKKKNLSQYDTTIEVSAKELGGPVFGIVAGITGLLVIFLIGKFVKKVNQGPFED